MSPRYPIYIPSKGRAQVALTPRFLAADGVPHFLVVEPQEEAEYRRCWPQATILVLPFSNPGSVIPARNWIKDHSIEHGHQRHWQLDDNIREVKRRWQARRIPCHSGHALAIVEQWVDRYENVAIAGLNYEMFLPTTNNKPPFQLNSHVYSCCLFLNGIPHRWRGRYNEDTDLCLQVLADGWCTVLFNAFLVHKVRTMHVPGGNTQELYQGDGRLRMARSLERLWPGVVTVDRRYHRPQHVVSHQWRRFDNPLRLRPGVDLASLEPNEHGLELKQLKPVQSPTLRGLVAGHLGEPTREDDQGTAAADS